MAVLTFLGVALVVLVGMMIIVATIKKTIGERDREEIESKLFYDVQDDREG